MTGAVISGTAVSPVQVQKIQNRMRDQVVSAAETADFSELMSQSSKQEFELQVNTEEQTSRTEYGKTDFLKQEMNSAKKADTIKQSENTSETAEQLDKLKEFSDEIESKVTEVIKEELGVTDEEIEQALEELGLTAMDLLNPANLADVLVKLTGSEDTASLLLNMDFHQLMEDISEAVTSVLTETGITSEELEQLLQVQNLSGQPADGMSAEAAETESGMQSELTETPADVPVEDDRVNMTDEPVAQGTVQTAQRENIGNAEALKEQPDRLGETQTATRTVVQTEQKNDGTATPDQNMEGNTDDGTAESGLTTGTPVSEDGKDAGQSFMAEVQNNGQNPQIQGEQPVTQADVPQHYTAADVENIMRQIHEFAQVNISRDTSSVEMQLNPENLGKVLIHITEKEGAVTAQIQTQNEVVKEALESQVSALRDTLEGQGVKVSSVEVTIASHEFERNLEQNEAGKERQEEAEEAAAKGGRRNLRLDELDDLQGLMSEEEVLVAKIMKENGNSVDLTA